MTCAEPVKVLVRGSRVCERCYRKPPENGGRYCAKCRGSVISSLDRRGYLQRVPAYTHKPKVGGGPMISGDGDSGLWHNLIREYEAGGDDA